MRILAVTLGCLFVSALAFTAIKQFGRSTVYAEYSHPMLRVEATETSPRIFIKPANGQLVAALGGDENLFLDVALTLDHKLVVLNEKTAQHTRSMNYDQIQKQVMPFGEAMQMANHGDRKFIFNFTENALGTHEIFLDELKKLKLEKGQNFIAVSEYEASMKSLKELEPSLIFGTTKPEILRLVAMESMYLIEATSLRADVVIHPLKIRGVDFYTPDLVNELSRRHIKTIIGPIAQVDLAEAQKLKPLGIIINGERSQ